MSKAALRRIGLAAAMSAGAGGGATTLVPGLQHWPPGSVMVTVGVIAGLSALLRTLARAALSAVAATLVVLLIDAATGGNLQHMINLADLVPGGVSQLWSSATAVLRPWAPF